MNQSFHKKRGGREVVYILTARVSGNIMIISSYPSLAQGCFLLFLENKKKKNSRKQNSIVEFYPLNKGEQINVSSSFFFPGMNDSFSPSSAVLVNQLSERKIKVLIHSICQIPRCKYFYHGPFQGIYSLTTRSPNS